MRSWIWALWIFGGLGCTGPEGEDPPRKPPPDDPVDPQPPDPAPPAPPDPTEDEYAFPFGLAVHAFALEIGPLEWASLLEQPKEYVPGRFLYAGEVYEPVAIRLKGNGSFQPIDAKPSFKIKFDEYVEDLEFHGLDRLVLNNMANDPSCLHERVAHRVFRAVSVPDVRASHASITVNGEPYGLYSVVENVDKDFLERWYAEPDGSMWEMFDVDFAPADIPRFEHEEGPDDRAVLEALAEILEEPEGSDWAAVAELVDTDAFLRYFAASAVLGQFDAWPYSYPGDDVHLYLDPSDGRLDFIPHGADETFEDPQRPITFVYGSLARVCLDDPACLAAFTAEVWAVQERLTEIDTLGYLAEIEALLRPHVEADPRRTWTLQEVESALASMRAFLTGRPDKLTEDLALPARRKAP